MNVRRRHRRAWAPCCFLGLLGLFVGLSLPAFGQGLQYRIDSPSEIWRDNLTTVQIVLCCGGNAPVQQNVEGAPSTLNVSTSRVTNSIWTLNVSGTYTETWHLRLQTTRQWQGGSPGSIIRTSNTIPVSVRNQRHVVINGLPGTDAGVYGPLTLAEGGSWEYAVRLNAAPTSTVTVTLSSADTGAVTVDTSTNSGLQSMLTFTTANWNTAQTVTVNGVQDTDFGGESVAVSHTASGGGYTNSQYTTATLNVEVADDEAAEVLVDADTSTSNVVDAGPLVLNEDSARTGTYSVRLSRAPTASVTVTLASDNAAVTLSASSLTFTTTNWATAQTVTATTTQDTDAADEAADVTHTASGGGYDGIARTLRVGVTDDERTGTDYDTDEDGLIEIDSLAKLNAVRWDLNGDGAVTSGDQTNYSTAFPGASTGMGCPDGSDSNQTPDACIGYELTTDLDFDTDNSGSSWTESSGNLTCDANDTYYNSGSGWDPIGPAANPTDATHYNAVFEGNGHSIDNLCIDRTRSYTGLFAALRPSAQVRSLGLTNAGVYGGWSTAPLAAQSWGRIAAVWSSGTVRAPGNLGGVVGFLQGGTIVASYSTAAVHCTSTAATAYVGGLAGTGRGTIVASYATGAVTGDCPAGTKFGLARAAADASYWDAISSGIDDDADAAAPEGKLTVDLQTPTAYGTGLYMRWRYQDVDGDGVSGEPNDDDAWNFGSNSQYPVLKFGGTATSPQFNVQPPSFGTGAVADMGYISGNAISAFQIPAAVRGGSVTYTADGVPPGLTFDADATGTCQQARTICGTPSTTGVFAVTIWATNSDGARGGLRFTLTVGTIALEIDADPDTPGTDAGPLALSEAPLDAAHSADYAVRLAGPPTGNVTVTVTSADAGAVTVDTSTASGLQSTLAFTTANWRTWRTVTGQAVQDADGADESVVLTHAASGGGFNSVSATLTANVDDDEVAEVLVDANPSTSTVVDPGPLLLNEDTARTGSYAVRLGVAPGGTVTVALASDNAAVTLSASSLTFTTANWATAQTVTATTTQDTDTADEAADVTHTASGGGYDSITATLRVGVTDDERTGTDYDTDEDGLIEISSLAQLNAVRWDLNGDGAVGAGDQTNYNAAFTGASTGMGCPDGGDANQTPDACDGYELTADLDFDTDGSGSSWTESSGNLTCDSNDTTYYNSGSGWDPIGPSSSPTDTTHFTAVFDGNGHVIDNLCIDRTGRSYTGLFAALRPAAEVRALGLTNAGVYGGWSTATLAGQSWGRIAGVWTSGSVRAPGNVGGLVGVQNSGGTIVAIYSTAAVHCTNSGASAHAGGLVGASNSGATVAASYSTGAVTGACPVNRKYGVTNTAGTVRASYWDAELSGIDDDEDSAPPEGKPSADLRTPTEYGASGLYATWNDEDVNGDGVAGGVADDPWNFGTRVQWPVLKFGGLDAATQFNLQPTPMAAITATSPAALTEASLNTATVTVTLSNTTFESGVTASSFTLTTGVAGVSVSSISTVSAGDTEATLTLAYGGANFDTPQTLAVTVAAAAHAGTDSLTTGTVAVAPTPGVTVSATMLSLHESPTAGGGTNANVGTYAVVLDSPPAGSVTVTATSADAAVTLSSGGTPLVHTLTFTTANWATAQTVTATAQQDDDGADESVSVTHAVTGYTGVTTATSVTVAVDDDETPGIVLDAVPSTPAVIDSGPLALNELGSATNNSLSYAVKLGAQPTATVTVAIASGDANAVAVGTATLTFTTANWDTAQTVTATAQQDNDGVNESVIVTHTATTASSSEYSNLTATITVTVADDEAPGFVFDADTSTPLTADAEPLNLDELAGSTTNADDYSVRLTSQPTQTVTVTVTSPDTGAVTVGTSTLTFTTANWDTAQTVTATAQQDLDGADESVEIAHAASTATNSEYTGVSGTFEAAVDDDETPAITLSPTALNVNEQNTASYTVVLATQPVGGSVTVAITGAGSGISIDRTSLSFTTTNWNTAQTVTASAADDTNSANEVVTLTHTATGADYDTLTADIDVTALDNDQPSLNVSTGSLTVPENASRAYTIRLNTQPSAAVTVTVNGAASGITVDTDGATTGDQNTLTYTTANWDTNQTVTVSAAEDDNGRDETVTLSHTASGGDYGSLMAAARPGVTVTADDNDTPAVLLDANPTTPNVDEAGPLALQELMSGTNTASYTVRLATEPPASVTVTIASADANAVSVNDTDSVTSGVQNTLTFTTANWGTAQTVTLTAEQDADGVPETVVVTNAASTVSMSEYSNLSAAITATVEDDETPGFVFDADPSTPSTDDAEPLNLDELAGSTTNSDDYSVRLAAQPTQAVTVTIASPDTGAVTVGTSTLTFTTANWDTAQTVTLTAQQDLDGADESVDIGHTASTASASEYTGVSATFEAAVDDDETPAVTVSPTSLTVPERDTAAYTVVLDTEPKGGSVTVAITGAADGLSASPTSLTFTASNWNTARTVTARAADDQNSANEVVTLTHTATGADYDTLSADIELTASDDDQPGLRVSPTALTVREGASRTYTIRLNTEPSAGVTVTVGGTTAEVTVDTDRDTTGDQTTLTFTTANWRTTQTVTVSVGQDDDATDETVNLTHGASGGDYTGLLLAARPGVAVSVDDDDTPAILIDADATTPNVDERGPLALNELAGDPDKTRNYAVRLATEPTQTVTVQVTSGDRAVSVDTDGTPRTLTLTFTTANWGTAQTVAAVAAEDEDASNERVAIAHAASGGDYDGVSAELVANTVDDDEPAIDVVAATLVANGVAEGATASYTVRLDTEPAGIAVVSVAASGDATVDMDGQQAGVQTSLRFDATTWNVPRTVIVHGLEDDDGAAGMATLRHTSSGADYGRAPAVEIMFAVADDDQLAVAVAPTSVDVNEDATAIYTVTLGTAPVGGPVTVTPTTSDADVATASPAALTFTAGNWNRPQRVTVAGVADSDTTDGSATISHAVAGADYGAVSASPVAVAVRDVDAAGVRIEPPTLTLREGARGSYRVRLNTEPAGDVTVTATSATTALAVDEDETPQSNVLTFTTANWATAQAVRVSAAADDDAADAALSISHAVSGYAGVTTAPALPVDVEDDDAPGMRFAPAAGVSLSEADPATTATYTVVLTAQPTATVTVALSSDDAGLAFDADGATPGDQTSTTFTTANWNTAQTVTVRAVADGDAATETATLLHAASGGGYDDVSAGYPVRLSDADAAAAPASVAVRSAGPRSLTVSWTASANAEAYLVQWRVPGTAWSTARQMRVVATAVRIENLETGTRYEVRVIGLNRGDPGDPSAPAEAMPSALANRAPEASGELPELALAVGETRTVDLSALFIDPDGDDLTFLAWSSDESVVTAWAFGSQLRVRGEGTGMAEIGLRATDPTGASATRRLPATVGAALSLAADAEAPEGGTARLAVTLSSPRGAATTFRWRVVADADPATADADAGDHGGASGEATIPAGETSVEIEVRIADDEAIEPAREWFEVAIEAPANGCCTVRRARARVAVLEGVCDRTPAVADALRGAAACTAPTPAALASRTRLAVTGAGTLRADDFQGMAGLQWLDLSANGLSALPEGAFGGAVSLRELDLSGNALAALPPQPFAALPGLRALDLSGNGFAALPAGLFAGLSLREASLEDNPGAPFALAVELARTDADRWADGPATVEARLPTGAPFPMRLPLTAEPTADGLPAMLDIPAGATAAEPFAATAPATGALTLRADAATLPPATCGAEWPFRACFRGLAPMPSEALTLFRQPPRALPAPEPEPLAGDDLRLPLASLIAAGDGALRWQATSSDESVAVARILGGSLLVEPELAAEGTAEIVLVATDSAGLTATVRFEVQVEFFAPTRPNTGWRSAIRTLAPTTP